MVKGEGDRSKDALHRAQVRTYSDSTDSYVAARYIRPPPFDFNLGDGRSRGSGNMLFYNAPLERGNSYRVFVRYHSELEPTEVRLAVTCGVCVCNVN